jgi:hypothetical protein
MQTTSEPKWNPPHEDDQTQLAAYDENGEKKECLRCGTLEGVMWRETPATQHTGRNQALCAACSEKGWQRFHHSPSERLGAASHGVNGNHRQ